MLMKTLFHPLALRLLAAGIFFLPTRLLPAQGASGAIEGRVFNAATGAALRNARVSIEGTNRETLTSEDGAYRLASVPAGETRVSVSYLGFDRQTVTVTVPASGAAQRDVELSRGGTSPDLGATVKLQEFTVVADREMSAQAIAMNEQRNAPNIKSVVALDEYGDRGDENRQQPQAHAADYRRFGQTISVCSASPAR